MGRANNYWTEFPSESNLSHTLPNNQLGTTAPLNLGAGSSVTGERSSLVLSTLPLVLCCRHFCFKRGKSLETAITLKPGSPPSPTSYARQKLVVSSTAEVESNSDLMDSQKLSGSLHQKADSRSRHHVTLRNLIGLHGTFEPEMEAMQDSLWLSLQKSSVPQPDSTHI